MNRFPILDSGIVYLDSAATSQKPIDVIEAVSDYYKKTNANVHRGIYKISEEATKLYEEAHIRAANLINAKSMKEIIFTRNTTESINLLAYSLEKNLKKDDEILISKMEHHSNIVPWQELCKRTGAKLKYIDIDKKGNLIWDKSLVTNKTKIISVTHVSNVLGTINPVEEIGKDKGDALFIVDGAQSVPHMQVDVNKIGCDFLVFSSHKMLGPTGIGVLYGRKELLEEMDPFLFGGDMIRTVTYQDATWNELPWKFEAGTPDIAGGIGFGKACEFLMKYGMDNVFEYEKRLTEYALNKLKEIGAIVYGPQGTENRIGVISFNIDKIHPHDLASVLSVDNICIRAGQHCAMPLLREMKIDSCARMSFYIYNTIDDIDKAIESMKKAKEIFGD